jgi:WD40 repeat protein
MRTTVNCLRLALMVAFATHVSAQKSSTPAAPRPLVLTGAIPLPNVQGRIDHFGFDPNNRLFVSALGKNTEEVIDLSARRVVHSIANVPTPQGVVYSPETNKLFVASAKGKVYIYDGASFDLITSIDFHGDADNLRYSRSVEDRESTKVSSDGLYQHRFRGNILLTLPEQHCKSNNVFRQSIGEWNTCGQIRGVRVTDS